MDCPDEPGNDGGEGMGLNSILSAIVITGLVPVIHLPACSVS